VLLLLMVLRVLPPRVLLLLLSPFPLQCAFLLQLLLGLLLLQTVLMPVLLPLLLLVALPLLDVVQQLLFPLRSFPLLLLSLLP
jgi:hypothetical protein